MNHCDKKLFVTRFAGALCVWGPKFLKSPSTARASSAPLLGSAVIISFSFSKSSPHPPGLADMVLAKTENRQKEQKLKGETDKKISQYHSSQPSWDFCENYGPQVFGPIPKGSNFGKIICKKHYRLSF